MLKRRWKISNSILPEPRARSAIRGPHCSDRARWDGACVSPTPIKWDRGTDGGIIDRREKGNVRPSVSLLKEKIKAEEWQRGGEVKEERSNNL